jgi:putative Mn2+ efflux pump MntP
MQIIETSLIGTALAMDAMAASVALGTSSGKRFSWDKILMTGLFFGLFQAWMPLAGWFCASLGGTFLRKFGQYLAAALLFWIGGKMAFEKSGTEEQPFSYWKLTVLAFATSIDALLVGVSYSCLGKTNILKEIALIGVITFLLSCSGSLAGRFSGKFLNFRCGILGGIILMGIGIKILCIG